MAGPQEGSYVDLAFAQGLEHRGSRRLVLILPKDHAFATLQRAPWFKAEARPDMYLHDGVTTHACDLPTQDETVKRVAAKHGGSPEVELRKAATPKHLGARSNAVYDLVEWATTEPLLDASHRRGERSWHCMGQKVLSIKATTIGLAITAGIHYGKPCEAPAPVTVIKGNGSDRRSWPRSRDGWKRRPRRGSPDRPRSIGRMSRGSYKPFLHHVTKGRPIAVRPVKLPVPQRAPRTLEPAQIVTTQAAQHRLDDDPPALGWRQFLVRLIGHIHLREAW